MKVLIWETSHLIGGGQQMSLVIANILREKYHVEFLIPKTGPLSNRLNKENISYRCLGNQILSLGVKKKTDIFKYCWMSIKSIFKFLRSYCINKPDIIYVPGPAALPWGAICGMLIRRPVVWHLHHLFEDGGTKKLLNILSNLSSIRTIIGVSDCVRDQLTSIKIKHKLITMYNPIDRSKYKNGKAKKIFEEVSLTPGQQILIGHVGIIQEAKRQEFVIRVVAEILKRGYSVHALLVGSARTETMDYEQALHKLVKDLDLEEYIHFMGQRQDVADILAAVDVVIIPSIEGLSLVGLEALAAGKPIVSSEAGGSRELVEKSKAGIYFSSSNDVIKAADAIIKILRPEIKQELYNNSIRFTEQQSYEKYQKFILQEFNLALK